MNEATLFWARMGLFCAATYALIDGAFFPAVCGFGILYLTAD